ncbi:HAMP domain-containing sensor histidine kinase [Mitsuaria sp. GD03876]|uniref:sensor histidine kinase n=1 Tax=Mitsuaria sp. GD03876 TaxID=2975399 RepID=UPI00244D7028|nr:HAMP domain-containing sensor histidine kinase [Mitsuaria sp. GD03876]MDH0863979.1 HAMP domain-containing histidine kinase [Mitsuaria sp. GD03876]
MTSLIRWFQANQIRITIRGAFSVFLIVTVALPYLTIRTQKERSDAEQLKHREAAEQRVVERLLSPAGQLALANPSRMVSAPTPLRPVILPFSEIQADMPGVVLDQVRAVGCPILFKAGPDSLLDQGSICVGVRKGDSAEVRGRLLITGTFLSSRLVPHVFIDPRSLDADRQLARRFQDAHRIRLTLQDGKDKHEWILPVQLPIDRRTHRARDGLSLTAYRLDASGVPITWRPDFTGAWIIEGECIDPNGDASTCLRENSFSIAIPRDRWSRGDGRRVAPNDLQLDAVISGPNHEGKAIVVLDSRAGQTVTVPFGASDIDSYVAAGESLTIYKKTGKGLHELFSLARPSATGGLGIQTIGARALRFVGVDLTGVGPGREERRSFGTRGDSFEIVHHRSARGLDPELVRSAASVATVAVLMFAMTGLAWGAIEFLIMRRVMRLTRRTRLVSLAVRTDGNLKNIDFTELKGQDELGVLATGLDDLLKRIADDVQRNTVRIQQERSMLRAIGHEIRGPLQSLSAVLADSKEGSGYVRRMLKAVAALYGSASPSDGIQSAELEEERLDLSAYLHSAAKNAHHAGIEDVTYQGPESGVEIRADQAALEDVFLHILQNANRYRPLGTTIIIRLEAAATTASVTIHNNGPHISSELLDRIFEYGVSDRRDADEENHGQGLFVAATYLSKMGGTISARNVPDGVDFVIDIPVLKA